jgi:hypothetical protein
MKQADIGRTLGYLGLLPFVVFAIGSWLPLPLVHDAHAVLLAYAAVILSFMGAIHWGLAMTNDSAYTNRLLASSVIPALLGWIGLLLAPLAGYLLISAAFIGLFLADRQVARHGLLPDWYLPMRAVLTSIVVLCLLAAALSLL